MFASIVSSALPALGQFVGPALREGAKEGLRISATYAAVLAGTVAFSGAAAIAGGTTYGIYRGGRSITHGVRRGVKRVYTWARTPGMTAAQQTMPNGQVPNGPLHPTPLDGEALSPV